MILKDGIFTSTVFEGIPVIHGFTTRPLGNLGFGKKPGDPEVIANRQKLFGVLALTNRTQIQPKQVHSNRVISAVNFIPGIEADASIATDAQSLLSVLTADCLPILLYHRDGFVSAVHAGWRGLYDGIIPNALAQTPPGPVAAIGPAIGPCCYEVGEDLAASFEQKFGKQIVRRSDGKNPHLDLIEVAVMQLEEAGVEEMEVSYLCSSCHPDLFFSYRRDGSSGRQMSFIGLK